MKGSQQYGHTSASHAASQHSIESGGSNSCSEHTAPRCFLVKYAGSVCTWASSLEAKCSREGSHNFLTRLPRATERGNSHPFCSLLSVTTCKCKTTHQNSHVHAVSTSAVRCRAGGVGAVRARHAPALMLIGPPYVKVFHARLCRTSVVLMNIGESEHKQQVARSRHACFKHAAHDFIAHTGM